MAQSAAMARGVVGIANIVGLAGITAGNKPAGRKPNQGRRHLTRLLGEVRVAWESARRVLGELVAAVRASLSGLVHNRKQAWPATQFRPGIDSGSDSGSTPMAFPTEKDSGRGPPR